MITKINQLKTNTSDPNVKSLCDNTISALSSAIYNNVTNTARLEIETIALNNLFEELSKYSNDKIITEWLNNQKRIYSVKNIGVRKAVNALIEKESKYNDTLAAILENFREQLDNKPEILLYESFISAMAGFNHLPAVNTELDAVAQRVSKYKNDIDITKIIETMKSTRSNYLVPLIEDVVDNYLNNKSEQTKSHLKETLVKFSYDPFVRDIINIVTLDATNLQLEYVNAECDIDDKLFSPIMYLGENEALFNIKETYYIKKGNNINKLKSEDISKIDENFHNLCNVINLPGVEISKKDIKIYIGQDNAILTETQSFINGKEFKKSQINESFEIAKWSGNTEFFNIVNILRENYDEIAELDFVKRVYLKENENYAADIFKLRDNIFITTFDPINNKNTFYRNINPIQAEKVMMEHMRFDVSKTFEEILPNKEKILLEISETKQEYSSYIKMLEDKINEFSTNYGNATKEILEALVQELDEVKNDFKNYLNEVETFTSVAENLNITVQDDSSGKSYTVVVPIGAMAAKGETKDGMTSGDSDDYGTEVGATNISSTGGAASAVTFDDDESELLSDEPSDETDQVNLGADETEAKADIVNAETELEKNNGEESMEDAEIETTEPEETSTASDELGLGNEENSTELDLEEPAEEETETEEETGEETEETEEAVGAPNKNLEKTNFNKDRNPNDLEEPKKPTKVYLKRPKVKK